MKRTIKVIKKGEIVNAKLEDVRKAAFERLDGVKPPVGATSEDTLQLMEIELERIARERVKQWIYECRSNKLIQEAAAREFWKLH